MHSFNTKNSTFNIKHSTFKIAIRVFIIATSFIILISGQAQAQMNVFEANLDCSSEYSDNIMFTEYNPQADLFVTAGPSVKINYSTETVELNADTGFDAVRYRRHSEQNYEKQDYRVGSGFKISERLNLSADLSFANDATQNRELAETGELTKWQKYKKYTGKAGADIKLTEVSGLGISYNYLKEDFTDKGSINYNRQSISMSYSRFFNDSLDTVSLAPHYEYRNSYYSRLDNYSLELVWKHAFNETSGLNVSLGGRHTVEDFSNNRTLKDNGWLGAVGYNSKTETSLLQFGYTRDLHTNVSGGESEVNQFYAAINKEFETRLEAGLEARLYLRKWLFRTYSYREKYYVISPTLNYNLAENYLLSLGYNYANQSYHNDYYDIGRNRNSLWLILKLKYNKIL